MPSLPTIVFIPGLLCDAALWRAQIETLAGRMNSVVADTTKDDTIAAMAARLLDEAPARFALCALSMGGYVAMEVMRRAPDHVTHLILSNTSARADSAEQRQRRQDLIALAMRGRFMGVTPRLLPQLIAPENLDKPAITRVVMEMAMRLGKEVYIRQQTAIMGRDDSRSTLENISCPTKIVVGEADSLTPVAIAEEMARLIPGARLHVVPQAGHLVPLESPQIFNQVLRETVQT